MKAVYATPSGIELVAAPEPEGEGVMIHVRSAGICGTDLHVLELGMLDQRIIGHEIAGVTDDGTPVVIEPLVSCGTCSSCIEGDRGICDGPAPQIMGLQLDGGMAERLIVPPELVMPVPSSIGVNEACLIEPLAVAVRALQRVEANSDTRVAVIGGGSIGLATVAIATAMGATVELSARHDHQREAGERLGATAPTDEPCKIVVEAAGTGDALSEAVARCAPGGKVSLSGSYWSPVELPGMQLGRKEISLIPSVMYGRGQSPTDFEVATNTLATNPDIANAMITHRFPLDAADEAFAVAADRSSGAIKVVIEPTS